MKRLFPHAVYFAGLVAEVIVRMPYERQRRRMPKPDRRMTGTERAELVGLSFAMLVLPLTHSLTTWLDCADYRLSPNWKRRADRAGTVLLAAAVSLFWRSHRDLGPNWSLSLEISAQQTLTTDGIYHTIRHPMYASDLLYGLAQALLLQNWIAGLAGLGAFLPLYLARIPREERMMLEHFGEAYRAYCAQTGRIVPRLRGSTHR